MFLVGSHSLRLDRHLIDGKVHGVAAQGTFGSTRVYHLIDKSTISQFSHDFLLFVAVTPLADCSAGTRVGPVEEALDELAQTR